MMPGNFLHNADNNFLDDGDEDSSSDSDADDEAEPAEDDRSISDVASIIDEGIGQDMMSPSRTVTTSLHEAAHEHDLQM